MHSHHPLRDRSGHPVDMSRIDERMYVIVLPPQAGSEQKPSSQMELIGPFATAEAAQAYHDEHLSHLRSGGGTVCPTYTPEAMLAYLHRMCS